MVQREYASLAAVAIFDRRILDEFCATVGSAAPVLVRGVVQVYLSETPQTIALIRAALEAPQRQRAADLLHRLKGSSLSIGATRLAHACMVLEQELALGAPLNPGRIIILADEYTLSVTALEAYLAERSAR